MYGYFTINYTLGRKYRPTNFEDIVLDPYNYIIMKNIIKYNNFPNLLLYGPPGLVKLQQSLI